MRFSIVTPTLNRGHMLPAAIESVLRQEGVEVEHIIVDGLSTDSTGEVLSRYPHLRVLCERDQGLYDALNKGIAVATGDIIGHLNSDDQYTPGALRQVLRQFQHASIDTVSGGAEILGEAGEVKHRFMSRSEIELNFSNVTFGALNPNARFFTRDFCQRVGVYDLTYRVAADREWMFRARLLSPREAIVEEVLYRYLWHAGSLTFSDDPLREQRWREEYLRLAESWIARPGLPREARSGARRWHGRESAEAATRAWLKRDYPATREYALRGRSVNFAWPLIFLRHLGGALLGR